MSSQLPNSAQQIPQPAEDDKSRVEVLKHLLEKLERESLALVRQSEAACELLGARVEELDEQVQEQSRQEDFLLERLYYWRQRFSDLEKSKQYEERRLQNLINDLKDKYMGEHMYRLIIENFRNAIRIKNREINEMRWVRGLAEDDGPQSAATKETKEETKEPKSNDDPTPYWLTHNHPRDWYGIALEASRPSESLGSRSRAWFSSSHEEASEQPSPEPQSPESLQFGPCPPDHHRPELHHIPSGGWSFDGELESAHVDSDLSQGRNGEEGNLDDVEKLKAENEMLRLQVRVLEDKNMANAEQERKRGKLYAEFLRWAPKVQQEGWLTNKVRKAYAACQKIVEALELGD